MARSNVSVTREHVVLRQSFFWPENQLIFWIIVMIVTSIELITSFAALSEQQNRLGLGQPWYVFFMLSAKDPLPCHALAARVDR